MSEYISVKELLKSLDRAVIEGLVGKFEEVFNEVPCSRAEATVALLTVLYSAGTDTETVNELERLIKLVTPLIKTATIKAIKGDTDETLN